MGSWDLSASLVRITILVGAGVALLFLRRWLGGPARSYLAVYAGLAFLVAGEAIHLARMAATGTWGVSEIAWDSVYIHAAGYVAVLLGCLFWFREYREARSTLERDNLVLRHVAETDFLTELINRRQAKLHFEREVARARRRHTPVGFIMIDLDHFKRVNDTFGHQGGDAVLAHLGRLLRLHVRSSDIVVRYGGEEFLIVLPEAAPAISAAVAEKLRALIEGTSVACAGRPVTVTASFGVAVLDPSEPVSVNEIIGRADEALYVAKNEGRNRVVSWPDLHAPASDSAEAALAGAGAEA